MSDEAAMGLMILSECCGKYGAHTGPDMAKMKMELAAACAEVERLQAWKDWVHTYLDNKGVPKEVQDEHLAAGCRIGGRLDWVFGQLAALSAANAGLRATVAEFEGRLRDCMTVMAVNNLGGSNSYKWAAALLAAPAPESLVPADERDKRIAELEAALKPFVEYVSTSRFEGRPDHWRVGFGELTAGSIIGKGPTPTLGDCRRSAELLKPNPQPAPSRVQSMICPDCKGNKFTVASHVAYADGSHGYMVPVQCSRCAATGSVPDEMAEWIRVGAEMRKDRLRRNTTLRDEAIRRGMEVVTLSRMEFGKIQPVPRQP